MTAKFATSRNTNDLLLTTKHKLVGYIQQRTASYVTSNELAEISTLVSHNPSSGFVSNKMFISFSHSPEPITAPSDVAKTGGSAPSHDRTPTSCIASMLACTLYINR